MFGGTSVVLCENSQNFEPMSSRAASNYVTILKSGQIHEPRQSALARKQDIIKFPWNSSWLSGDEYQHILLKMDSYCKYLNFKRYDRKTHPLSIYTQPQNGLIYFVRGDSIGSDFGFPRLGVKKVFKWQQILYAQACNIQEENEFHYEFAKKESCGNLKQSFVLCHIRKVQAQSLRNNEPLLKSVSSQDILGQLSQNHKSDQQFALPLVKSKSAEIKHKPLNSKKMSLKTYQVDQEDRFQKIQLLQQQQQQQFQDYNQSNDSSYGQIDFSPPSHYPTSLKMKVQSQVQDQSLSPEQTNQNQKQQNMLMKQNLTHHNHQTVKNPNLKCTQNRYIDGQSESTDTSPLLRFRSSKTLRQSPCDFNQQHETRSYHRGTIQRKKKRKLLAQRYAQEKQAWLLNQQFVMQQRIMIQEMSRETESIYNPHALDAKQRFPCTKGFLQHQRRQQILAKMSRSKKPKNYKKEKTQLQDSPYQSTQCNSQNKKKFQAQDESLPYNKAFIRDFQQLDFQVQEKFDQIKREIIYEER